MASRAQRKADARAAREAAERQAATAEGRRRRLRLLGGVLAAAAVLVLVAVLVSRGGSDDGGTANERVALFDGIAQEGQWLGRPDAPVVVEEYADLQCPFCAQFAIQQLPSLLERVRSGEVRMRLRLVDILGPDSTRAALAAGRAEQEGRLWQFSEAFFASQGREGSGYVDEAFLRERASEAGLDADAVLAEDTGARARELLDENNRAFESARLEGTPSFRVGPRDGELETVAIEELDAAIERAAGT